MQVNTRSILGAPVYNIEQGERLGLVHGVIVAPADMKVHFFVVALLKERQPRYLQPADVRSITRNHIAVNSEASLASSEELVRYEHELKHPLTLFGYRVWTVSHKKLGTCYDFVFDAETLDLTKIYVKAGFMQRFFINHHIIDVNDVVRIEPGTITVRDAIAGELRRARNVLPVETT